MHGKFTDVKFHIPSRCPKSLIRLERTLEVDPADLGVSGGAGSEARVCTGLNPALETRSSNRLLPEAR